MLFLFFFSCTSDKEILDLTLGKKFFDNCTQFDQTEIEKVQLEAGRIVSGTTKLVSLASLYNELGWEELSSRRRKHKLIVQNN